MSFTSKATTSVEDYVQNVLLFSNEATFKILSGIVIVLQELDQKCFVRLVHQIHFQSGLYPQNLKESYDGFHANFLMLEKYLFLYLIHSTSQLFPLLENFLQSFLT